VDGEAGDGEVCGVKDEEVSPESRLRVSDSSASSEVSSSRLLLLFPLLFTLASFNF
jgi:hypothetical protein